MLPPTNQELADLLHGVTERLEQIDLDRVEDARQRLELLAGDHAMREAILQFTQELAAREGFSVPDFVQRFEAASRWHRDRFLRTVERVDPDLAARIDTRHLADVPTDEMPPAILPD